MGLFGGGPDPAKIAEKMAKREEERLAKAEERAARRESFETIEGQGIMERADISLGSDFLDDEEGIGIEEEETFTDTGLVI